MNKSIIIISALILLTIVFNGFSVFACDDCGCKGFEFSQSEAVLDSTIPQLYNAFPDYVNLSEYDYFPPIGKQVGSSCAAWATTYYQFTFEVAKYMSSLDDDIMWRPKYDNSKVFSPQYVWQYLNNGKDEGISFETAYDFLTQMGSVKQKQFNECSTTYYDDWGFYGNEILREALDIRLSNVYTYKYSDSSEVPIITEPNDTDLYYMKFLLNTGHPFVVGTFFSGFVTENLSNGELVCTRVEPCEEGHAMIVVGYDDDIYYDLNGDNDIQDFEKGAFLLANSHGKYSNNDNNGYIWVMYDALNSLSNCTSFPSGSSNRLPAFYGNEYKYIEVSEYRNDVLVEITIQNSKRNDFSISIGSSEMNSDIMNIEDTLINKIGGNKEFSSSYVPFEREDYRIFLFDYNNLYDQNNDCYSISIRDYNDSTDDETQVHSIRWLDSNGNVLYEIDESFILSGEIRNITFSKSNISNIFVPKYEYELYYNEITNIKELIYLIGVDENSLEYTSNKPNVINIDSIGNIIYESKGEAIITIESTDNSLLSKTITLKYIDDYRDNYNDAYELIIPEEINGTIDFSNDVDYFKFTAPTTGNYVIYTEGATDTIIDFYLYYYEYSEHFLTSNDDYSTNSGIYNAGVGYYLEAGNTYLVKVSGNSSEDGDYKLNVKSANNDIVTQYEQTTSEHHFSIDGNFLAFYESLTITYGGLYFQDISISDKTNSIIYNDDEFYCEIIFTPVTGGEYTTYDIDLYISTDFVFNENFLELTFKNGTVESSYDFYDYIMEE